MAGADCVDCGNEITGFPTLPSVQEATCSTCNCYTRTHDSTLNSLLPERAKLVKERLQNDIIQKNRQNSKDLAALDAILKKTSSSNFGACSLDLIEKSVNDCSPSADHLQAVFGHSSIKSYLGELAQDFGVTEGSVKQNSQSCLSSHEIEQLNNQRAILNLTKDILSEFKSHKSELKEMLNGSANMSESNQSKLLLIFNNLLLQARLEPTLEVIFNDDQALLYIIENAETLSASDGEILDFFENEVYQKFPRLVGETQKKVEKLCQDIMSSVTEIACVGDGIAFMNDERVAESVFRYIPSDHEKGFDSLFVNDDGRDSLDTNFVNHLYWCTGKSCNDNSAPKVCAKVPNITKLDPVLKAVSNEADRNRDLVALLGDFDPNSLCKLADCSGTQTQMNVCYENVKKELGPDADAILLSYSRVQNQQSTNSTQATGFDRSEFARNFLGSYEPKEKVSQDSSSPRQVEAAQSSRADTSAAPAVAASASGNRVVTANQAFQEFMNQRFDSLANSSSTFKPERRASTSANNTSVGTGVRVSNTSSNDRRALETLNEASETIEGLREGYRKSAFERMQRLVEQAASQNNNPGNASNRTTSSSAPSVARQQEQRATAILPAAVAANVASANINGNTAAVGDNNNNAQAAVGRSPSSIGGTARITTNASGQQTLNVSLSELPSINSASVANEGVDTNKPFNIAVKVDDQIYMVQVRPALLSGKRMLEPMLDQLTSTLRAEVLKSPLFEDYRKYLVRELVTN